MSVYDTLILECDPTYNIGKFTDKIFFVNGTNIHEVTSNMYSASSLESPLLTFLLPLYVCVSIS